MFDMSAMMEEFNTWVLPYLNTAAEEYQKRKESRKLRLRAITARLKSKVVPLPLGLDRKFENGMSHEDVLPVFSDMTALPTLMAIFARSYEKAGGKPLTLLDSDPQQVGANSIPLAAWKGKGDTVGILLNTLHSAMGSAFDPVGLLVIENLDDLIDGEVTMMESRPARLVRSLSVLQQLQSRCPVAIIVGIDTSKDKPQGMRPQESYPPYLIDRPHVWADCKQSKLAGGSMNVQIDSELYTFHQLSGMLVDDE
jgi:hypothetical protein